MPVRKALLFFWLFLACPLSLPAGDVETLAAPGESATAADLDPRQVVRAGIELERSRQWSEAIEHYEKALEKWPDNDELKYGLRRSRIHLAIERRYTDRSFRQSLLRLSESQALACFDEVLEKIRTNYVDPISTTSIVAHGTESLYLALANDRFVQTHLAHVDSRRIQHLRAILRERYWNLPVSGPAQARQTVLQVCGLASRELGLPPVAVILEYVCGGCNALDDYSNFLTPDRLQDLYGNIDGEFVGIGIEMKAETGQGMLLMNVLPDSPARAGGLQPGDHIVAIDGIDCRNMTTDEAAGRLRGPAGSEVHLEILSPAEPEPWRTTLVRRAVKIRSIPEARIIDPDLGIAYLRMTGFQKTTPTELDQALYRLHRQGMRALIWDVRGNPGGLLTSAVEVLDRFIAEGVLVSTRGRVADQNWTYRAHRRGTWTVPLVLLTDGDSASASEIVAGAIRDHHRGVIVGRKTYGKWSVQTILSLNDWGLSLPQGAGLRLTTARFYSPRGKTLGKIGLKPDIVVKVASDRSARYRGSTEDALLDDADIRKGIDVLQQQLARR